MAALRSPESPMLTGCGATDEEEGLVAAAAGVGFGLGTAAVEEKDEDRLERDTRLSRASNPKIAQPRLRSS
jgi:hypothetical protein